MVRRSRHTGWLRSAALAIRFWMPESSHMPLSILVHSLIFGVVLMLLVRSVGRDKTGPT